MGNSIVKVLILLGLKKNEIKVVTFGLDNSGKTTILYKLKVGEVVQTIPTLGFNVETVEYKKKHFAIYDIGGGEKARQFTRIFFPNTKALLCVIDSCDRSRLEMIKKDIHNFLNDCEIRNALFMVLANKQDLPNAMSVQDVAKAIELDRIKQKHNIFGTAATNGINDGLKEAFGWLYDSYMEQNRDTNNKLVVTVYSAMLVIYCLL